MNSDIHYDVKTDNPFGWCRKKNMDLLAKQTALNVYFKWKYPHATNAIYC